MAKICPSARSLQLLRKEGWTAEVCEKWIPSPQGKQQKAKSAVGFRRDLFLFMDILAYSPLLQQVLAVQTTTKQQMTGHLRSYRRAPVVRQNIMDWLAFPNRMFVLHGWEKTTQPTKMGGTKVQWVCHSREIHADDLVPTKADIVFMRREAAGGRGAEK